MKMLKYMNVIHSNALGDETSCSDKGSGEGVHGKVQRAGAIRQFGRGSEEGSNIDLVGAALPVSVQ